MKRIFLLFPLLTALVLAVYGNSLVEATLPEEMTAVPEIQVENDRLLYVYISGAVKSPGVYSYKRPLLVGEVIKDAGGFNSYADSEAINAAAVRDLRQQD